MASDGEDAVEDGETEEEVVENNPLNADTAGKGLSLLCKTASGLAHAYVRLDVHEKQLTDVAIVAKFIHLRYVDVSGNFLTDISPLNSLPNLLTLNAERNKLESLNLSKFAFLQVANFSRNNLTRIDLPHLPALVKLSLALNQIEEATGLEGSQLPAMKELDLHGNLLTTTTGINIPHLEKLYVASNHLQSLGGVASLTQLTTLHARDNQVSRLDDFTEAMQALQYINLRGNPIADLDEVAKLKCLPLIRALILVDCPVSEIEDYRVEVLIHLRKLERLDKDPFSSDERVDAEEISEQRIAAAKEKEEVHWFVVRLSVTMGIGLRNCPIKSSKLFARGAVK